VYLVKRDPSRECDADSAGQQPRTLRQIKAEQCREIVLDELNSKMFVVPKRPLSNEQIEDNDGEGQVRETGFIAGPAGSGKSTYCANYARSWTTIPRNKGKPIYLFSRVEKDPALDSIPGLHRVPIDQSLVDEPIEPKDLAMSLCIFDDIDTIPEKPIRIAVRKLRDDLLQTGRHNSIYVLTTSHILTNFGDTRVPLSEANFVTFFPRSGSTHHIRRFLDTYAGFSKKEITRILQLPSRWVTVYKTYPQFVMFDSGIYLAGQPEERKERKESKQPKKR
jgi:hypothetical protein